MFSAVCCPRKHLHSSIRDCMDQFQMKWHVIPKNPFICRFDQRLSVSKTLSTCWRISLTLLLTTSCFFANNVVERFFRDGTTYHESREPTNVLKEGLSTIESGSMTWATRDVKASVASHCQGSYFLHVIKGNTVACSLHVDVLTVWASLNPSSTMS